MTNMENIHHYGQDLLLEIQFWQININILQKACEKEEKRIISLQKRVIDEIDRIQTERENNESKSKG